MDYAVHLAILVVIFAILGLSLNLVVGFTGLLSVAHAAFYGIGAYALALLTTKTGLGFMPALLAGMLAASLAAVGIGLVLSRFRGDYYALASMGFATIVHGLMLNWRGLTHGPLGVTAIPRPSLFSLDLVENGRFLLFALVILLAVWAACRFVARSSFGRALKAIREDEDALRVFGYDTPRHKLAVFAISAALAAIAGALFASYVQYVDPASFVLHESVLLLALVIMGGLGSLPGSVLGAAVMLLLPEALRFAGFPSEIAAHLRLGIFGLALVLLMRFRPRGLLGAFKL